ncbi:hypothetical protein C8Q75DRAFT_427708 [Abortiporus biennis]|nr:hypothetical protein C8Q75DRAFT_427708 [Abortiporus biennis]
MIVHLFLPILIILFERITSDAQITSVLFPCLHLKLKPGGYRRGASCLPGWTHKSLFCPVAHHLHIGTTRNRAHDYNKRLQTISRQDKRM